MIFPLPVKENRTSQFVLPDFSYLHQELKQKGVTLQLLWEEYSEQYGEAAYSYSQFRSLYREWREKMFVDYAGQTVFIVNAFTGEVTEAKIFVAVLGASNYCYAEATLSQSLPDWINSHVRAFDFFGGVPQVIVPDNLKTGVTRACRYEPEINQTYAEIAAHYQTAVIPSLAELNRAITALVGGLNYRLFKKLPG